MKDLLNKMAEVLTHELKARWAIVLPVKRIVSYSSDEDNQEIKKESSKHLQVKQPLLKRLKSNENLAFPVKKEPDDDDRKHKFATKLEDNEEVETKAPESEDSEVDDKEEIEDQGIEIPCPPSPLPRKSFRRNKGKNKKYD